jgi:hypothetical protein
MRKGWSLALALLLSACGGGGGSSSGGTLHISFSYQTGTQLYLFRPATLTPAMSGFEGHEPHCSLAEGSIPPGMSLRSDCTITGQPTQAGVFQGKMAVGADGVSNELNVSFSMPVMGPSLMYHDAVNANVGASFEQKIYSTGWIPVTGETVTYSVQSGSLPEGIHLDPATGRLYGVSPTEGHYTYKIQVAVVNAGRTAVEIQSADTTTTIGPPLPIDYFSAFTEPAWAGLPFTLNPKVFNSGATYAYTTAVVVPGSLATLPAGLSLDPNTGEVSGISSAVNSSELRYGIAITGTNQGVIFHQTSVLPLQVMSPVYIFYGAVATKPTAGVPFSMFPTIRDNSHTGVTGISYAYSLHSGGNNLGNGLHLDPVTGEVSGTPLLTQPQSLASSYRLDVVVTLNGVSFTLPVDLIL